MTDKLTESQNIQIGMIAAVLESVLLQPTLFWKNAKAAKAPLSLDPRIVFRGTLASCLNECQSMGLQFGTTGEYAVLS